MTVSVYNVNDELWCLGREGEITIYSLDLECRERLQANDCGEPFCVAHTEMEIVLGTSIGIYTSPITGCPVIAVSLFSF